MAVGACEHVVVLIPGFLSFDTEGRGAESQGRVVSVLRSALEAHCHMPVPVVAFPREVGANLQTRQRLLLRRLQTLDGMLRGVQHFHLVGHGPGGLDAELLTVSRPLAPSATWDDLDPHRLRERLTSVITLATPHYGTHLAEQPLFSAFAEPLSADSYPQAAHLASALFARARSFRRELQRLMGPFSALPFLLHLLRHETTLTELCPAQMQALRAQNPPDPWLRASVQSVVVVAPEVPAQDGDASPRARDELFSALHALTGASCLVQPAPVLTEARALLSSFPVERVIGYPGARLPAFELSASDGLVNGTRQLLLSRGATREALAAVVIADHADVLGYYEQTDWLEGREGSRPGLLCSGANFGDDQFFHLWGLIAARIAEQIEGCSHPAMAAQ
jgi:hypothetical protein